MSRQAGTQVTVSAQDPVESELRGQLTALLFVADGPLTIGQLARILETTARVVERAISGLAADPPAGLALQRQGNQIQLATAPAVAEYVRRLRREAGPQRLSRAALEVLAVVAYGQPTTRAEIEAVRGVNSDHVLDTLVSRGLVEEVGRRETIGRPTLFGTTLDFLRLAGLGSLGELPAVEAGGSSS